MKVKNILKIMKREKEETEIIQEKSQVIQLQIIRFNQGNDVLRSLPRVF